MRLIDFSKSPAKLLTPVQGAAQPKEVRIDIVETIYDTQRGRFMALVRSHVTGKLQTVDVENILVGSPGANLVG